MNRTEGKDVLWSISLSFLDTGFVLQNEERRLSICTNQRSLFRWHDDKEKEIKKTLTIIYDALRQKGYNPINQIVGYILSEDPTYITTYNNARSLIRRIDRDELLQILVKSYLGE